TASDDLTEFGASAAAPSAPIRIPDAALARLREERAYQALSRTLQTLPPEMACYDHNIAVVFLSNENIPGRSVLLVSLH
ncbi:hypothetical protein PoB_000603800, partial [Plakobranchus ocellatus]